MATPSHAPKPGDAPRTVSLPNRTDRKRVCTLERAGVVHPDVVSLTVGGAPPRLVRRAAQYVRMSTEHQQYSIGYQCEAIRAYVKQQGLVVVRTYTDEARSGLTMEGRPALRALLADVVGKMADFEVIVVYDVSRWGRFQDSDEAAYYEYLCRREGLEVHYCAEPFRNDGTAVSSLIKNVKRMMAGEYSRELSERTVAAKCQAVRMGRWVGGPPLYGYRRLLVDAAGRERRVLYPGEAKSVRSDRIVLVPGPADEIAAVRWMFQQEADRATPMGELAAELNRRGFPWHRGGPWLSWRVQCILTNEKYIGNTVYNRVSLRLKGSPVRNPPGEWVRVEGTHEAIVDPEVFWRAQEQMNTWTTRITNEGALVKLRELLDREGHLSARLIYATPGMPHPSFYRDRFGGLTRAYELIGYTPARNYRYLSGFAARKRHMYVLRDRIAAALTAKGLEVRREHLVVMRAGDWLGLGVLYAHYCPVRGSPLWFGQYRGPPWPHFMLFARLNERKSAVKDYCLISGGLYNYWLGVRHRTPGLEEWYSDSLDPLLDTVAERAVGEPMNPIEPIRRTRK